MTYNELLQQKEWWSKCNEILQRDHFTCKDCGCLGYHNGGSFIKLDRIEEMDTLLKGWFFNGISFSRFVSNFPKEKSYRFVGIVFQKEHSEVDLNIYNLNLYTSKNKLFQNDISVPARAMVVSQADVKSLNATVYSFNKISKRADSSEEEGWAYLFEFPINLTDGIYTNIEYALTASVGLQIFEQNLINITFGKRLLSLVFYHPIFFSLKGLNIHHTYYIKGYKPWEYDNEALVTLCEDCHKKRHETSSIPYYDTENRLIRNLIKCDRCGGSGYLPQYSHVEHGICFKCGGEGVVLNDYK